MKAALLLAVLLQCRVHLYILDVLILAGRQHSREFAGTSAVLALDGFVFCGVVVGLPGLLPAVVPFGVWGYVFVKHVINFISNFRAENA